MQMTTRRSLYVGLAVLISILVIAGGAPGRGQVDNPIPAAAQGCIDRSDPFAAGGAELMASQPVAGTNYYLVFTYEDSHNAQQYPSALLLSVRGNTCDVQFWNTAGDFVSYANYVPMAAAVKFRQAEFDIQLERLGRERFITAFDLSQLNLLEEETRALENLGVLADIRGQQ